MLRILMLLALMLSLPTQALAASQVTAKIQSQYDSLQGFTADFKQYLKNAQSGEAEERSGRIAFKQPQLIRWETRMPEKELLLVGKDAVWNYFEGEGLAIKYPVSQILNSRTMIRFISGKARLDEDFIVEDLGREEGAIKLRLTPKEPEMGLVAANLWVDPSTYLLRGVQIFDFYGNENRLRLENVALNPGLPDSLFTFTPPKGVLVQDNTKAEGEGQ